MQCSTSLRALPVPIRHRMACSFRAVDVQICSGIARARHGVEAPGSLSGAAVTEARGKMKKSRVPRCGARTRRGTSCIAAAIWSNKSQRYTRCKNHGGMSTGPRTVAGLERIRQAALERWRLVKANKLDPAAKTDDAAC